MTTARGETRSRELARDLRLALDPAGIFTAARLQPDSWQSEFLRLRPQRALLCCCRQAGKSMTTAAAALHEALYQPGALILMLAPSQRQSAELLRKTRSLLTLLGSSASENESALALTLANGSRIVSLPGKEATIRGFSDVALLAIDEAARVEEELYIAVRPMLAVSGGRLVALSTPYGQRGWFHQAWTSNTDWHRVRVSADDCPRISAEFLAEERRTMSQAAYASEYLCEFTDAEDSAFRHDQVMAALDHTLNPLYPEGW